MKINIEALSHDGKGIGRINGKVYFISNTLVGEEVEINNIKDYKNYSTAEVVNIIKPSNERRDPLCPYYTECGGCDIMHMNYETQVKYKQDKIKNILEKYCHIKVSPEIVKSDVEINYRNKITLHRDKNILGFYKHNTNEVIEISECLIAKDAINKEIKKLKTNLNDIIIRASSNNEVLLSNKDQDYFIEFIGENKYKVNINSFFQVNDNICSKLIQYVSEQVEMENVVFDLYCGVGTFSIPISKKCKKVFGIEYNENAINNANENKIINKVDNIDFICGKVENELEKIKETPNLILVDPARFGLHNNVIEYIMNVLPEKIIYISCEPMTMSRDLSKLLNKYSLVDIKLFDMFPNTHHVESVVVLHRN